MTVTTTKISKYPPATPEALDCEPLKVSYGIATAAQPDYCVKTNAGWFVRRICVGTPFAAHGSKANTIP